MKKPKIVILDEDLNYIGILQNILIEQLSRTIDLEFMTDLTYARKYLSEPKKIDILLISENIPLNVSENQYIKKILILSEKEENVYGDSHYIYKYSDSGTMIKNLTLYIEDPDPQNKKTGTQIILITSATGGVGKTTIALSMVKALNQKDLKTLYIDAESLPVFYALVNTNSLSNEWIHEYRKDKGHFLKSICSNVANNHFSYMPYSENPLISSGIKEEEFFVEIINQFVEMNEYQYIIVDSNHSFDLLKVNLLSIAKKVIIIGENRKSSIKATHSLVNNINDFNYEKYSIICNKFDKKNHADYSSVLFNDYLHFDLEAENMDLYFKNKDLQKILYLF